MLRRLLLAACAALPILVATASPAAASRTQLSVFQDDQLLVTAPHGTREAALDEIAALGADVIHTVVNWRRIAPSPTSKRRPANFNAADPAAYRPLAWAQYDALVRGAAARGMRVLMSPSGPIPSWASGCKGSDKVRRTCRPNPTHFMRFVEALATRYSGSYGGLPRVDLWSVWNEPNQGSWLKPQYVRRGGRTIPTAPAIYRTLVRATGKALKATGHGRDQLLFGETAPLGRTTGSLAGRPMAPGAFLRGVLCLDRRADGCRGPFPRLPVTGISHHPYSRGGSQPPSARGGRTEITIASRSRLTSIVDAAARKGRVRKRLPVWYTEFGFQTNPPDSIFGVPLDRQATWLNQADWMAWKDARVRAVAQYELRDERNLASFQTGLRFASGRVKPSMAAYRLPIWVTRAAGGKVRVWGQVRPAGAGQPVQVQSGSGSSFATVATATTVNAAGYLDVKVPAGGKKLWRLRWAPAGRSAVVSRVARVARR
jgi:hypothetical protein